MENGENKEMLDVPRVKGSEVFVGGLQQNVTEEMIREVFSQCGEIVEIRMMTDHMGAFKGYGFVRFTTKEAALKAQKEKDGITLQGKKIKVAPSTDQDTLFLGNIKKDWTLQELESMVKQAFQDVTSVDLAMSALPDNAPPDAKPQNRGFAFVHFITHAAAARAFRVANRQDFVLGSKWHPVVDWAESATEPAPEELSKVKVAFVGNLPNNTTEEFLKNLFEPFGKIERVAISRKGNPPVGFVHFEQRSVLDAAVKELDGKIVDGIDKGSKLTLQVSVAKPKDKSKKRAHEESKTPGMHETGTQIRKTGVHRDYTDYPVTKYSRVTSNIYSLPELQPTDPYEAAVLALPTKVTDKLLQIFRKGVASPNEVDINILESLKELPESAAFAVLNKFSGFNSAEIRNKGAYLASMINRELRERGLLPKSGPKPSAFSVQNSGALGLGANVAAHLPLLDSYNVPPVATGLDTYSYDGYLSQASSKLVPSLPAEPLSSRVPILPSNRLGASPGANFGLGVGVTPEHSAVERRQFRFDPFTGEPYRFDPYTGERLDTALPSSALLGREYY